MTTPAPAGRLICRAGTLAGRKFELGAITYLGADDSNRAVVSEDAGAVRTQYGRIYATATDMYLESSGAGALSVDGAPVSAPVCLGRMHVISMAGGEVFMFTRVTAAAPTPPPVAAAPPPSPATPPAATPPAPAEPIPPPAEPAPPPAEQTPPPAEQTPPPAEQTPPPAELPPPAEQGHTVVDMVAFGALPDLARGREPASPAPSPPAPPAPPSPAPPSPPAPAAAGDEGHTVVDMVAFGALPQFAKREAPPEAPKPTPEPMPAVATPAREAPPTPTPTPSPTPESTAPAAPSAPSAPEAAHTVVDMIGFGSLPQLGRKPEPTTPEPPKPIAAPEPIAVPPAEFDIAGTVAFVRPDVTPWELSLKLPGGGTSTFALKPGDNTIGRSPDCDVVVADPEMWLSRKHAIVRVQHGVVELVNLKGKNGSFVNGQRVDSAILTPGSAFVLGPHFEFKLKER